MELSLTIRGRTIDHQEFACIKQAICHGWDRGRTWISQELCRQWDWRQGNGKLKDWQFTGIPVKNTEIRKFQNDLSHIVAQGFA